MAAAIQGADRGMDEVGFLHFGRRAMLLPDDMLLDLFDVFGAERAKRAPFALLAFAGLTRGLTLLVCLADTTRNGKLAFADFLVLLAMATPPPISRAAAAKDSVFCRTVLRGRSPQAGRAWCSRGARMLVQAAAAQDARDTTVSSVWCKFL